MAQSRKTYPYRKLEGSALWRAVEKAIAALVSNADMQELTAREYIVGPICHAIAGDRNSD